MATAAVTTSPCCSNPNVQEDDCGTQDMLVSHELVNVIVTLRIVAGIAIDIYGISMV